ncbi:MAG TPA: hypothetical protein VN577_15920 [Terriglobales bacterium]|nr:hypothetical protein [Terriglobales bacterium]
MSAAEQDTYDAIFVLAGRVSRKIFAIGEFERGRARTLLLSTARFELRKFPKLPIDPKPDLLALAATIPAPERHCFVQYPPGTVTWVKKGSFGTMTEIVGLKAWLERHPAVKTILVVSSGSHIPRVRLCCQRLLPVTVQVSFQAVPGEGTAWLERAKEAGKRLVYRSILTWSCPQRFA